MQAVLRVESGDSFWQANLNLGYRFKENTAEIGLSVLNLFDQDYQLSSLNPFLELPRERTFRGAMPLCFLKPGSANL